MTTLRQAAEMALEALENCRKENEEHLRSHGITIYTGEYHATSAIDMLREALAQPEQEPIARLLYWHGPAHYPVPHDGVAARTFSEFPKEKADDPDSYWKNGGPLYLHPAPIPEGWQLVPNEPTPEMIAAASDYAASTVNSNKRPTTAGYYVAMLDVAPKPEELK